MPLDGEYWELQMLIRAFGSFRRSPVIRSLVLPDVPYGTHAFVRILLLFLLILCLYMPRLLACTRYIVDCEPSWLLISLLYLQLVDYMLYSENSYINNRCAIRRECHGFTNPCGLRSRVVTGTGTGWQIVTPAKPVPVARV